LAGKEMDGARGGSGRRQVRAVTFDGDAQEILQGRYILKDELPGGVSGPGVGGIVSPFALGSAAQELDFDVRSRAPVAMDGDAGEAGLRLEFEEPMGAPAGDDGDGAILRRLNKVRQSGVEFVVSRGHVVEGIGAIGARQLLAQLGAGAERDSGARGGDLGQRMVPEDRLKGLAEDAGAGVSGTIEFEEAKVVRRGADEPGAGTLAGMQHGHSAAYGPGDGEEEIFLAHPVSFAAGVGGVSINQHMSGVRGKPPIDPIHSDAGEAHGAGERMYLMVFGTQHLAAEDDRRVAEDFAGGSVR
jgi:hypothetical protein